eukprot:7873787-Pyramimonas_sp.AAC.1
MVADKTSPARRPRSCVLLHRPSGGPRRMVRWRERRKRSIGLALARYFARLLAVAADATSRVQSRAAPEGSGRA